jgi:hypothetical protein
MSSAVEQINNLRQDAILWKAKKLKEAAGDNVMHISSAIDTICVTFSHIKNEFIREKYYKDVAKIFGEKTPKHFIAKVNHLIKEKEVSPLDAQHEDADYKFPSFFSEENRDQIIRHGFTQVWVENDRKATGIYFAQGNGSQFKSVSNFTIRPLFHVWSQNINENKKLFEVKNAHETAVIDIEAAATISVERFSLAMNAKHNFMWAGNIMELKKLMEYLGYHVQRCEEVKILGWQPEGFFAYTDKFLSNQEIVELNEYGIGTHNNRMYFSPSRSVIYKGARADDNMYETLSFLNYQQSPITFEKWASLMHRAYPGNGKYAISYAFICLFRDLVLKVDGNCPHLYVWGSPGSGKSKMMESLVALFFNPTRSFQLNSGTDFALSRFLEVFRNTFHFLNELDDTTVKPLWLQWLKGAYDNEGRERGKGGSKNMTEVMKVNSAIGLAGQKIVNVDDNALPMRCIIRNFRAININEIPQSQLDAYNELKKLESDGGFNSLLIDILKHRETFARDYHKTFAEIFVQARKVINQKNYRWSERIARNYCYLLAMVKIANENFILPFTYAEMFDEVIEQINDITTMITGTDATSEFWRIINKLADQGRISRGYHYRIETLSGTLSLYGKEYTLTEPKRILFLRLETTHSFYKQDYRSETGREGINIRSLLSYLETKEYFIGSRNKQKFFGRIPGTNEIKSTTTSCYVFDYELMEKNGYFLDFETERAHNEPEEVTTIETPNTQQDLPF